MNQIIFKSLILLIIFTMLSIPVFAATGSTINKATNTINNVFKGIDWSSIINGIVKIITSLIEGLGKINFPISTPTPTKPITSKTNYRGRNSSITGAYCLRYAKWATGIYISETSAKDAYNKGMSHYSPNSGKTPKVGSIYIQNSSVGGHASSVAEVFSDNSFIVEEINYKVKNDYGKRKVTSIGSKDFFIYKK